MVLNEPPQTIFCNDLHSLKHFSPIVSRFWGKTTDCKELQFSNVRAIKVWIFPSIVTVVKRLQPENAPEPNEMTFSGIIILPKELQSLKALVPIVVRDSGNVNNVSEVLPAKLPSINVVTPDGTEKEPVLAWG